MVKAGRITLQKAVLYDNMTHNTEITGLCDNVTAILYKAAGRLKWPGEDSVSREGFVMK